MDRAPSTKPARIYCGVSVDGAAVYARVMIPADQEVCLNCLGLGTDVDTNERCECCDGLGTVELNPPEED